MPSPSQQNYRDRQQAIGNKPALVGDWFWQGYTAPGYGRIMNSAGTEVTAPVTGNAMTAIGTPVLYVPGEPVGTIRLKEIVASPILQAPKVKPGIAILYSLKNGDKREFWVKTAKNDVKVTEFDDASNPLEPVATVGGTTLWGEPGADLSQSDSKIIWRWSAFTITSDSDCGGGAATPADDPAVGVPLGGNELFYPGGFSRENIQDLATATVSTQFSSAAPYTQCGQQGAGYNIRDELVVAGITQAIGANNGSENQTAEVITPGEVVGIQPDWFRTPSSGPDKLYPGDENGPDNPPAGSSSPVYEAWISSKANRTYVIVKERQGDSSNPSGKFDSVHLATLSKAGVLAEPATIFDYQDSITVRPQNWRVNLEDYDLITDQPSTANACYDDYIDFDDVNFSRSKFYQIDLDQPINAGTLEDVLPGSEDITAELTTRGISDQTTTCTLATAQTSSVTVPAIDKTDITIEGIAYLP